MPTGPSDFSEIRSLLTALAERARSRPGLYPVKQVDEFVQVIADVLNWYLTPWSLDSLQQINDSARLKLFHERAAFLYDYPEESHHWAALSEIRRGRSPFIAHSSAREPPAADQTARAV
jgi:hypothetical protein